jgi:hypothetical protein
MGTNVGDSTTLKVGRKVGTVIFSFVGRPVAVQQIEDKKKGKRN